jgi:hypothetical protein
MKEINELKAKAYDMIGLIEYYQSQLNQTNKEIKEKIEQYNEALKKTDDGEQLESVN